MRLLASAVALMASLAAQSSTEWDAADQRTVRLPPSAFPVLSSVVRAELSRRGCVIPQTYAGSKAHNVFVAALTGQAPDDVAVLCSTNRQSSILVFRHGSAQRVDELARRADVDDLMTIDGEGRIGYTRAITSVPAGALREYAHREGSTAPTVRFLHSGIEDGFHEAASILWYWDGQRWISFAGAD